MAGKIDIDGSRPNMSSRLEADFGNGKHGWSDIQEFQPVGQFRAMIPRGAGA